MRRAALACALAFAGCADELVEPWQLAHDRVVAVRVDPPHVPPGATALITALVADADGPAREVVPRGASAPFAPGGLFTVVHFNLDHWEINSPDDAALEPARAELGLPAGAPVPVTVTVEFPGPLFADKIVWLGDSHANPSVPPVHVDGVEVTTEVVLARAREVSLDVDARDGEGVRWLTSCGTLDGHDTAVARLDSGAACAGELAVVVRDALGGVSWRVWPLRVE